MTEKKILIVDDHSVTRNGLKALLLDIYPGTCVFEAWEGDGIMQILKQQRIDLAILDLQLPNTDTISLIEWMSIRYPHTYILVFSMLPENIYGPRVITAGASGYLPKDAPMEEIKKAFELALANKKYASGNLLKNHSNGTGNHTNGNPFEKLSHREFEIARLLMSGKNITAIGQELSIKPSTVGTYKSRVLDKLNIQSVFELKELGFLYGLNNHLQSGN